MPIIALFFASRAFDDVAEEASRQILTGQAQKAGMTQSQFATYVCQHTHALFNCNNFMINVQNYSSFAAANIAPKLISSCRPHSTRPH